jgi:protein SCO1/2
MRHAPFKFSLIVGLVLALTFLAGEFLWLFSQGNDAYPRLIQDQAMTVFVEPKPLKEFLLIDQNSNAFDLSHLKGKWSFLFFGFTHCPDICPSTLVSLSKLRARIIKDINGSNNIQLAFISVDPKRDTGTVLKQYIGYFDPSIIGLTGTDLELRNLSQQLDAKFEVAPSIDKNSYQVYHTSAIFLINPQGQYVALLTPPFDISTINRRFIVIQKIDTLKSLL